MPKNETPDPQNETPDSQNESPDSQNESPDSLNESPDPLNESPDSLNESPDPLNEITFHGNLGDITNQIHQIVVEGLDKDISSAPSLSAQGIHELPAQTKDDLKNFIKELLMSTSGADPLEGVTCFFFLTELEKDDSQHDGSWAAGRTMIYQLSDRWPRFDVGVTTQANGTRWGIFHWPPLVDGQGTAEEDESCAACQADPPTAPMESSEADKAPSSLSASSSPSHS